MEDVMEPERKRPIGPGTYHLCVDMQRMFAESTEWHLPWMDRVRPVIREIAGYQPDRTVFTRFMPVKNPESDVGQWRNYYRRWQTMTLEQIEPDLLELVAELQTLVPPAMVFNKRRYSPWLDGRLHGLLGERHADTLIITGGETDVCVIATVLGAVDLGYRVIVVRDALCSVSDDAHDAALRIYDERFNQQVETSTADALLSAWRKT
jgi:nicotinamidase-related amidase